MTRKFRLTAGLFAVAAALALPSAAIAGSFSSDHKCSPGQHGNNHPGFKPGTC